MSFTGRTFAVVILIAILAGLAGCASQPDPNAPFQFMGKVYDDRGRPVQGAIVTLGEGVQAMTDISGMFVFPSVVPGTYTVTAKGVGLETYTREILIANAEEVLFISMISLEGLLDLAKSAMRAKDWKKADGYIARALAIDPENPLARFAEASAAYAPTREDRDWQKAEKIALSLLDDGYIEAAIYLLLADIAQYDKGNVEEAIMWLEKSLTIRVDPAVEARVKALKAGS